MSDASRKSNNLIFRDVIKSLSQGRLNSTESLNVLKEYVGPEYDYNMINVRNTLNQLVAEGVLPEKPVADVVSTNEQINKLWDTTGLSLSQRLNSQSKKNERTRVPKDLRLGMRPYTNRMSLSNLESVYQPKTLVVSDDNVNKSIELLTYLNDANMNFRLEINRYEPDRIVASLDEYGITVDIMNDDISKIGRVNSWRNQMSYTTNEGEELPHPATIVDMVTGRNTLSKVEDIKAWSFSEAGTKRIKSHTIINLGEGNSQIMTTALTSRIKTLDDVTYDDVAEDVDVTTDDESEFDESGDLVDDNTITTADIKADLKKRNYAGQLLSAEDIKNDPYASRITETLANLGIDAPTIYKNNYGTYKYRYEVKEPNGVVRKQTRSIGGFIPESNNGTYEVKVNDKLKGHYVPGLRGFIDSETGALKVKKFDTIFNEKISQVVMDQVANPALENSVDALHAMDSMYSAATYGSMIELGVNDLHREQAIIDTLKGKIRLDNELISSATTFNSDRVTQIASVNARDDLMLNGNLRVINPEWWNVIDREITSIGKNQGGVLFLGDQTTIAEDGTLIPGEGVDVAVAPVGYLEEFAWNEFDPIDRNVMGYAQYLRNVPVTSAKVALMEFGGWDMNDPYIVSKKFAEENQIKGKDGVMRPLMAGDKLTDFHGNKGCISIVIDADMSPEEAKALDLEHETAIFRANPDLEMVVSPVSVNSRFNAGIFKEMQNGDISYLNNTADIHHLDKITMANLNIMVSDMQVDKKTVVYDNDMVRNGRGRRFSHQLLAGLNAHGADETIKEGYRPGTTSSLGWGKYMDDLNMLGFDLDKNQQMGHVDFANIENNATVIEPKADVTFVQALGVAKERLNTKPRIAIKLPTEVELYSGKKTDIVMFPINQLRADMLLKRQMGEKGGKFQSIYMNTFGKIYDAAVEGNEAELQTLVNGMTNSVKTRDFSKEHNVVKNDIYSSVVSNSATAVVTPDPRLDLDVLAVGPEIYDNLKLANPDDKVLYWRDPILTKGGVAAFKVVKDERLVGCAMHPANDNRFEQDHDGDSGGIVSMQNPLVQKEWSEKVMIGNDLIDPTTTRMVEVNGKMQELPQSYLETGLNVKAGAISKGRLDLHEKLNDPKIHIDEANEIIHTLTRGPEAFGNYGIDVTTKESIMQGMGKIGKDRIKGSSKSLENVEYYYDGNRTDTDITDWYYALGSKVDLVGPGGALQQQMVKYLRNLDVDTAMNSTRGATQTALQVKHDPEMAKVMKHLLTVDMKALYSGSDRYTQNFSKPIPITTDTFIEQMNDIMNDDVGLNQSSEVINRLAEVLSNDNGYITLPKEREYQADPMDLIAYGGLTDLNEAVSKNRFFGKGPVTGLVQPPQTLLADSLAPKYESDEIRLGKAYKYNQHVPENECKMLFEATTIRALRDIEKEQTGLEQSIEAYDDVSQDADHSVNQKPEHAEQSRTNKPKLEDIDIPM